MTVSDFTTLLICLPIGAAVLVWGLPLSRYATGALAVLVLALPEVVRAARVAQAHDFLDEDYFYRFRADEVAHLHAWRRQVGRAERQPARDPVPAQRRRHGARHAHAYARGRST